MPKQTKRKLNRLERLVPEGLLVDAAWLREHGYSSSLRSQYVQGGWLEQPAREVYRRNRGPLHWSQTIVSLQTLLARDLTIGGRTALVLQGFSHYLAQEAKAIHLYGPKRPPSWLGKLPTGISFVYHNNSERLFQHSVLEAGVAPAQALPFAVGDPFSPLRDGWARSLTLSQPERALLELLDELPNRESFHEVDKLMEGLYATLNQSCNVTWTKAQVEMTPETSG